MLTRSVREFLNFGGLEWISVVVLLGVYELPRLPCVTFPDNYAGVVRMLGAGV